MFRRSETTQSHLKRLSDLRPPHSIESQGFLYELGYHCEPTHANRTANASQTHFRHIPTARQTPLGYEISQFYRGPELPTLTYLSLLATPWQPTSNTSQAHPRHTTNALQTRLISETYTFYRVPELSILTTSAHAKRSGQTTHAKRTPSSVAVKLGGRGGCL